MRSKVDKEARLQVLIGRTLVTIARLMAIEGDLARLNQLQAAARAVQDYCAIGDAQTAIDLLNKLRAEVGIE